MAFTNLKKRIKKNEGYRKTPYKDQLGFYTIGFGHLIKKNEYHYFVKIYEKNHFKRVFDSDFNKAKDEYKKIFFNKKHTRKEKELLIEMLFQLGSKKLLKFNKMLFHLENKKKYMTCLEMLNSLWYKQTPKRVEDLIKNFIQK